MPTLICRRRFWTQSLLLLAAALLLLLTAVARPAEAAELHSETSPVELNGSAKSTMVLTTNGGTVSCSHVTTTGNLHFLPLPAYTLTFHFTSCTAFGFATVDNGWTECGLIFTILPAPFRARVKFECPTGKKVSITPTFFGSSLCTVTIEEHETSGVVDLVNEGFGPGRDVLMKFTLAGINYASSGGSCGESGSNGTLTGSMTLDASSGGLWVE